MQEQEIGVVTHYFAKISVGIIRLTEELKVGDTIHVKGAHDDFSQAIDSMQIEHQSVKEGKRGDEVGIKVVGRVHENDKVFKVIE
jgi:putative protease